MEKITKEQIDNALRHLKMPADSKLVTHLNACVHCGLCAESCMYYKTLGQNKFIPAYKVDLVASLYRRYCTLTGKIVPPLVNARKLDEKMANEMIDSFFGSCTLCGRCVPHCSIGVDIAYVIYVGRKMLSSMGLVPQELQKNVDSALKTGNNMSISTEDFIDTIEWMDEELVDELGENAKIPLNQTDTNVFYTLNPREVKFFPLSISAMSKIFYAAKEQWTLSTDAYDVTNYGLFTGDTAAAAQIAKRLHDEVVKKNAKTLVIGECGHGTKVNRWEAPNYFKHPTEYQVLAAVELLNQYIQSGKIKLDKSKNKELVTIHDPCQLVRNGGLMQQIRLAVSAAAENIVEMTPCGVDNFCCGGGGGQLAMGQYNERRLAAGKIKAEQIRKTGAKIVVTPCHNCVDQITQLNQNYKLNIKIKTIAELVADAIVL
ncbi:MAG: (Fe-S)-binding protein [Bacteroidales bacterium]|jgi:Fe-S oxidoreductase|nr:(Fe-S)-binding protein [Bacteroidales bacterium]